jgi:TRAP-type mannitol/chloroaromatic compound transport system permease small subunit
MIFDLLQLFKLLVLKVDLNYSQSKRKWQGVLGYNLFLFCFTLNASFLSVSVITRSVLCVLEEFEHEIFLSSYCNV